MKKSGFFLFISLLMISLIAVGCTGGEETVQQEKSEENLSVYSSFYPLYDLVNKIGGDKVDAELVVPHGTEVHSYEPSPRKVAQMEEADLFLYNGLELEPWANRLVENLSYTEVKTINASKFVEVLEYDDHDHDHSHEDENEADEHGDSHEDGIDEHSHGDYDPHIWLDPINMRLIAEGLVDQLSELDPENQEFYQANYDHFAQEIEKLDQEYKEGLADRTSDYILVSHSSFQYLADRYGLQELSVAGVSPHQEPSSGTVAQLTKEVKEHGLDYIFLEVLASPRTAEVLAEEADLEVLTLNPIEGLRSEDVEVGEDYFSIMRKNLETLEKALVD
ncbi:zinc ABC transporter substrate-binding protein [Natroniella sulfidigena]|uniref:metal ABC transporter solute-binding protein, Zn/Mn family n=1 Tax=Natroniella sulfidigena TaxID=723921 RepID=UPI00200B44DD|nr:zinc ABC transporter substrate-binding protein [Natroniella sulfidigena]MCK8817398.1 zinc ABC transporter substrate-binding protein [Natroniella sulfidigena]